MLGWIDSRLADGSLPTVAISPGRTTLRRLNREEYRYAILDPFCVDYPTTELLPADGVAHGFDVIGEALAMPPILFEKYFDAAESIAFSALPKPGEENYPEQSFAPSELILSREEFFLENKNLVWMFTNGTASAEVPLAISGEYLLRTRSGARQAGTEVARMVLSVDHENVAEFDVIALPEDPETHEVRLHLETGKRLVSASFVNDYFVPADADSQSQDRDLGLHSISLVGPIDQPVVTPFESRYLDHDLGLEDVVRRIAEETWRGEVDEQSIDDLLSIAEPDASDRERLRSAVTAILISPRFLFRIEPAPEGTAPWRELESHELATRMAAFLWSSVPDAQLLELASTGELRMPAVVHAEVDRMLRDARASRLSLVFASQWLQLRRLDQASPDPERFQDFDDELRSAMRRESELFFDAILREGRPVSELLGADFTFVNERLARHYGMNGVRGNTMQRVAIPPRMADRRCGILGQAAVLTATSNASRTSPVRRGKFVLEALLATPPSPPPPGADSLDESIDAINSASIRERLEEHRSDKACAVCHAPMDGLGLALEHFDGIGVWRDLDGKFEIDDRAELPDGVHFEGAAGLRDVLLKDRALLRGLTRHLATFALGHGLVELDEIDIDSMLKELPGDPSLRQVIHAIVDMKAFRTRQAGDQDS